MQRIKELHPDVYTIRKLFEESEYIKVLEEFTARYNHWEFNKREPYRSEGLMGLPRFGNLFKPKWDLLGPRLQLINAGEIAKYTAQKILRKNLKLGRVNTNIQFAGQESTLHEDGGERQWTLCCFVQRSWNEEFGGPFQILVHEPSTEAFQYGQVHEFLVPFNPNCAVLFRAHHQHRGYAPNNMCPVQRMSVAFTYTEVDAIVDKGEKENES